MRSKKAILDKLYEQFKMHALTTDVAYEDYLKAVGSGEAVPRRLVKAGWGNRWPRVMGQLKTFYPDVNTIVNPIPKEEPAPAASEGLEALKKASTKKEKVVDDE
jgi:hypothetical protein